MTAPLSPSLSRLRALLGLQPLTTTACPLRVKLARGTRARYASFTTIQRGFTLLETLVALAILAIALGAILRTAGAETRHTEELRSRLLADWVAQNRLALHASRGDWIAIGTQNGEDTQAGIRFLWKEEISDTPNPAFRRIEVGVYAPEDEKYALRKLTGYLVEQRRR